MKLLFLIISSILSQVALAQLSDSVNYYVNYLSAGIINKTNNGTSYVLNNAFKFNVYKKSISLNSTNHWIYGKQQTTLTNNDFFSVLDFDLYKTQRDFYYWGLINYEKSFSLKITHRLQTGLGVGYHIINTKKSIVTLSDGILYEKSDLYDTELTNNEYETFRNSLRLKFRFVINDIVTLDGMDFVQHALSDKKDYIIRSTTHVSVKLVKWLNFTAALSYNKLNRTERENLLFNFGLSIEKYF